MRRNNYDTNATFVSANGTTLKFKDILDGAVQYVDRKERAGYLEVEDAEDIQQESAKKAWMSVKGYDETKSSPKTYGNRIAVSCSINAWEKKERFGESFSSFERVDDEGEVFLAPEIDGYRSDEDNPERDAISNEKLSIIWGHINGLDDTDRLVMVMTIDGFKPKEIADALGCTPDAASVRLHRVRKALKSSLRGMIREYGICA